MKKAKFKKLNLFVLIISAIIAILLVVYGKQLKERCFFDSDCSWTITNCCPKEFGAKWECVNKKSYEPIKCPERVLCYPIPSPEPGSGCVCQQGRCVVQ